MFRLYRISGYSLTPEYQPGDFVLVSKIPFLFHKPRVGETIAFQHPAFGLLIKQVTQYDSKTQQLTVLGTHPDSVDSREFGTVPTDHLIGKVLWHIHPKRDPNR